MLEDVDDDDGVDASSLDAWSFAGWMAVAAVDAAPMVMVVGN